MGSEALSDLFGWMSIACWLGAQFPQVLENARRKSCEGLALPFLLNWLLGDITNFVGCILTHQLPFQTILAAYFCSVDFMLFTQYFYYSIRARKLQLAPPHPTLRYSRLSSEHRECAHEHYREISNAAANVAVAAALAAVASEENLARVHSPRQATNDVLSPSMRRAGSRQSADVGEHLLHGPTSGEGTTVSAEALTHKESLAEDLEPGYGEDDDEVDEGALAALADSFHSEGGRKRVSWSQERYVGPSTRTAGNAHMSTSRTRANTHSLSPVISLRSSLILPSPPSQGHVSGSAISQVPQPPGGEHEPAVSSGLRLVTEADEEAATFTSRGRRRQRFVIDSPVEGLPYEHAHDLERQPLLPRESMSRSGTLRGRTPATATSAEEVTRRSSRASRRTAGLVFLGAWALFGVGALKEAGHIKVPQGAIRVRGMEGGRVLSATETRHWAHSSHTYEPGPPSPPDEESAPEDAVAALLSPGEDYSRLHFDEPEGVPPQEPDGPSSERIIGRISAWVCTTLYLTSRMPQIWKNFVRKSVEGLSIYLFIFAFLGNTFYVLSILTSPKLDRPPAEATAFLKESVPYLLGSGGTLMFDVTIVLQYIIYSRAATYRRARPRTRASSRAHIHSQSSPQTVAYRRRSSSKLGSQVRSLTRTRSSSDAPYDSPQATHRDVSVHAPVAGVYPHTGGRRRSTSLVITGSTVEEEPLLGYQRD